MAEKMLLAFVSQVLPSYLMVNIPVFTYDIQEYSHLSKVEFEINNRRGPKKVINVIILILNRIFQGKIVNASYYLFSNLNMSTCVVSPYVIRVFSHLTFTNFFK